jgi:epoxyqueuosine reductase
MGHDHAGTITGFDPGCEYHFRCLPVSRLKDLQEDIEDLKRSGKLSDNETYRSYIDSMKYEIPEDFTDAKSIIVLAVLTRPVSVDFEWNGKMHAVVLPHQYYKTGLTVDMLKTEINTNILSEPGHRLEQVEKFHLKLLAARAGLGKYGRNNIFYVDGLGTFLTLFAFLTDHDFHEDSWHEIAMLPQCSDCRVCLNLCPTGAIREETFVIDAGRCITLYNEIEGEFPAWIPRNAHNSLMGCMRCQELCPENREAKKLFGRLEDVTGEETRQFLSGNPGETVLKSVSEKLKMPHMLQGREVYNIVRRNLSVLLPEE